MTIRQKQRLARIKERYIKEGYKLAIKRSKKSLIEGYSDEDYRKNRQEKDKVIQMLNDMYKNMDHAIEVYDYDYNPYQVKLLKQLKNFLKKNISHFHWFSFYCKISKDVEKSTSFFFALVN